MRDLGFCLLIYDDIVKFSLSQVGRCKYNIVRNGDVKHLCDDVCFKKFRASPSQYLKYKGGENASGDAKQNTEGKSSSPILTSKDTQNTPPPDKVSSQNSGSKKEFKTCVVCQLMNVNQVPFCNWQGLDFCGESCLGKFQTNISSQCAMCNSFVPLDLRTSLCLKVGNEIRPFCKIQCHSDFKRLLKLCSFCQRNLATVPNSYSATVGGKLRDFCSKACQAKLEKQLNDIEVLNINNGVGIPDVIGPCSVCKKSGKMKHTVRLRNKTHYLCSDICLTAFQYTNKIDMTKCDNCGTLCTAEEAQAHFVQFEGQPRRFCSDSCVNRFKLTNTKMVPCTWCNTSKPNFDMIERLDSDNKYQLFCSLNCLSLYRVNLQAKSNQAVICDQCKKVLNPFFMYTVKP